MAKLSKALQAASVSDAAGLNVEDVFSTYLYTGNGAGEGTVMQTIENEIDLDGQGGMVWIKSRSTRDHNLQDTERGIASQLASNTADEETVFTNRISAFNSNGFDLKGNVVVNANNEDFASWSWRKARKFFDIQTWTGNGTAGRVISHNLGSRPGMIITKCYSDSAPDWTVWHTNRNGTNTHLRLNEINLPQPGEDISAATDTTFTVGNDNRINGVSPRQYVAYIFGNNNGDGNFGPTADQDIIKCGSYSGTGVDGNFVDLGFEPQWILIKNVTNNANWVIYDNMRGISLEGQDPYLRPANDTQEGENEALSLRPDGFELLGSHIESNASANTYIYVAIRRGQMGLPESSSEVFNTLLRTGNGVDTFLNQQILCDAVFTLCRSNTEPKVTSTRLFASSNGNGLKTSTDVNRVLTSFGFEGWDYNNGWLVDAGKSETNTLNEAYVNYAFKRSRGFFDIASYRGDGSSQLTVPHNLGVVPEMMLTKMYYKDISAGSPSIRFFAYHKDLEATEGLWFDNDIAVTTGRLYWGSTRPTAENFYVGGISDNNINACKYINYLFASVPGLSKVGSYQGNDGTQAIDCGFSNGAQFVILKNITGIGDWIVVDSQRGITSSTDPFLEFNTTIQEQTDDCVSANSSGFNVIQSVFNTNINATGNTYIFYAIAAP
jgi:hypothetical protein